MWCMSRLQYYKLRGVFAYGSLLDLLQLFYKIVSRFYVWSARCYTNVVWSVCLMLCVLKCIRRINSPLIQSCRKLYDGSNTSSYVMPEVHFFESVSKQKKTRPIRCNKFEVGGWSWVSENMLINIYIVYL